MSGPVASFPGGASYDARFIGRGFAWPMRIDGTGRIALTRGSDDIDDSIAIVLSTAPGERVMRPRFGCKIWDLLFEPITPGLLGRIERAVRLAIAEWEPRVEVDSVVPTADRDDDGSVRIAISYRVKSTNDRRNLVYPFYVIPHDAE